MRGLAVLVIAAVIGLIGYHVYLRTTVPADGSKPPEAAAPATPAPAEAQTPAQDTSEAPDTAIISANKPDKKPAPAPAAAEAQPAEAQTTETAAAEPVDDSQLPSSVQPEPQPNNPKISVFVAVPPEKAVGTEDDAAPVAPKAAPPAATSAKSAAAGDKKPLPPGVGPNEAAYGGSGQGSNRAPGTGGGGIRNWKPVKKTIKRFDQHNADLEKEAQQK